VEHHQLAHQHLQPVIQALHQSHHLVLRAGNKLIDVMEGTLGQNIGQVVEVVGEVVVVVVEGEVEVEVEVVVVVEALALESLDLPDPSVSTAHLHTSLITKAAELWTGARWMGDSLAF